MKTLYYLDINYEYDSPFYWFLNQSGFCYLYFKTRKEGFKTLKEFVKDIKARYKKELVSEAKNKNVLSIALYKGVVDDDFDEEQDDFYEASCENYHVVEERYLCGRW